MTEPRHIRLVTDEPVTLSLGDAKQAARTGYDTAREAQRALVSDLRLAVLLHRPGAVTYHRLKGELYEARQQTARARAVELALETALSALEAAARDE